MKARRPFRILIIEDEIKAVEPFICGDRYQPDHNYYFLDLLQQYSASGTAEEHRAGLEIYWSQTVDFVQSVFSGAGYEFRDATVFRLFPRPVDGQADSAILHRQKSPKGDTVHTLKAGLVASGPATAFLPKMDVVVLDIGGLSGKLPELTDDRVRANFASASLDAPEHIAPLTQKLLELNQRGAYFYHVYRDAMRACPLVVILSGFDDNTNKSEEEAAIRELVHPLCGLPNTEPFTIKVGKNTASNFVLHSWILRLYQDYSAGYTQLRHIGKIAEAAHHDYPVLIVGESGTGKEYIARSIHGRWLAERRRTEPAVGDTFVVINCAGLSTELARSELFGHVSGSFTGATDHRTGAILRACGCESIHRRAGVEKRRKDKTGDECRVPDESRKSYEDAAARSRRLIEALEGFTNAADGGQANWVQFQKSVVPAILDACEPGKTGLLSVLKQARLQLESAARGDDLVEDFWSKLLNHCSGSFTTIGSGEDTEHLGLRFKHKRPVGTLFLDEFGDLVPEVQNLLLRFLEEKSGEIQPIGYPGRITGLRIRLILATSDPQIAKFAGYDLFGTYRSDRELERELRHDLLFRVKGQVIRTAPITTQEALWATLEEMEERHSDYSWSHDAKMYLAGPDGAITKILKRPGSVVFGQHREIKRIIDLANNYMASRKERGLRMRREEVTAAILRDVWMPSELLMTRPTRDAAGGERRRVDQDIRAYDPLADPTEEERELRCAVAKVLGDPADEVRDYAGLQSHARDLAVKARQDLRNALEVALGIAENSKRALDARYRVAGRVFRYPGKKAKPSNDSEYATHVGLWWRGQVFRGTASTSRSSKRKK